MRTRNHNEHQSIRRRHVAVLLREWQHRFVDAEYVIARQRAMNMAMGALDLAVVAGIVSHCEFNRLLAWVQGWRYQFPLEAVRGRKAAEYVNA